MVDKKSLETKVELNLLVPNISFDFYKIKSLTMAMTSHLNFPKNNFQSGPLLCDQTAKTLTYLPVAIEDKRIQ